jgi:hypothetical protein
MTPQPPLSYRLCGAWIVFVLVAAITQYFTYSGPYAWLSDWQLAHKGGFALPVALIFPTILLIGPALAVMARYQRAQPPASATLSPQAERRLVLRIVFGIGILGLTGAAGAWLAAQSVPQRSDPPARFDLATWRDGAPPTGSVIVTGTVNPRHRAITFFKNGSTVYAPFNPPAGGATVRFFIEGAAPGTSSPDPETRAIFTHFRGVLVKDGLPWTMKRSFELQGLKIAAPHYLLVTGKDGARGDYYVATALCGFFGGLALILGVVILLAGRPHRASTRAKPG